ncbi:MAG: adenylate/guanylate cyclase domain-containing protein [Acidimicrobiia bacterium]
MDELPDGVVTFVFTDVEGSTRLWEEAHDAMSDALQVLDRLVDDSTHDHGGIVVKPRGEGDSHFLVFKNASDAVAGIAHLQTSLFGTDWPTPRPLRVRAALHTGAAELIAGDYYGPAVNRTARLRAIAHGGQTVISRATRELVADMAIDGVNIENLGEHRLKDLTRPEEVFQLLVDGLPSVFPPLVSLESIPNNLPEQLTDFIGRDRELARAKELLAENRLLTVLAPGGTGKTRLAIQVAADLAHESRDGVFFIALADISSSSDIVQAVAEALGVGLSADDDMQNQLLNYLSTKQQLLLFDNFEHVKDGAAIVSAILQRAPKVKIVATSREKLNLSGETAMSIAGLETTWETPAEAYQTSGVRLFVDAATRSNPGFDLIDDDLDGLARILRLIDGMPLAILLAASWVDMLGVDEIANEITTSLDFLETELGDVPDRHRSIRAVFDYSWATLDEDERAIFSRLSVFRGGFSREAAQTVAGANLRSLSRLVSKSLVTAAVEDSRYSVHEMLRQFAEEELAKDDDECERVLDAHAEFYSRFADDAAKLAISADQVEMSRLIETDIENVRSAWRRSLKTGDGAGGLRSLRGLYWVYEWRGWYPSAVSLFGEALEQLGEEPSDVDVTRLRAMAMAVMSWFRALIGQAEIAAQDAVRAKDSLPESTELIDLWVARQCVALGFGYTGAIDEMVDVTQEGIDLTASMDDDFFAAGMKNWRSFAAVINGDLETANTLLQEGMQVFERRHDHYFMTWNLWLQGLVALAQERPLDAIELFTRQVDVTEGIDYLRGRVVAFEGLGDANMAAGRHDDASVAYARSMVTADQMAMVADILGLMTKIGGVWGSHNRRIEAVELLSTVCAEPMSSHMTFSYTSPIRDTATGHLQMLESELDEAEYLEAATVGAARPWDVAAKKLTDSLLGA